MKPDSIWSRLDPELVVQEALYGFIMALTLVLACQLGITHYDSRNALILAIIGMDFVWGIIDMVIFYRVDIMARNRRMHTYFEIRHMSNREEQIQMLESEFDNTIFRMVSEDDRRKMLEDFLDGDITGIDELHKEKHHYLFNAVTAFVVSFSTVIPVVLCLVLIEDRMMALLVSSTVSSIALFFLGYAIAPSDSRIVKTFTGFSVAFIALVFTVVAALLGG